MDRLNTRRWEPARADRRIDARVKLLWLVVITITAAQAGSIGLVATSAAVAGSALWLPIRLPLLASRLRPLLLLLFAILVVRAFAIPGKPLVTLFTLSLTNEGLLEGGLICWRLGLVAVAGAVFAAVTPPVEVRAALHWTLRPLLGARAGRVAILLSLVLRFVVAIEAHVRCVSLAQKARCVDRRKNPFYRIRVFALPLLVKSLVSADRLALAMAARCYTDEPTEAGFDVGIRDIVALGAVLALGIVGTAW